MQFLSSSEQLTRISQCLFYFLPVQMQEIKILYQLKLFVHKFIDSSVLIVINVGYLPPTIIALASLQHRQTLLNFLYVKLMDIICFVFLLFYCFKIGLMLATLCVSAVSGCHRGACSTDQKS